jgi:hypothetical protein
MEFFEGEACHSDKTSFDIRDSNRPVEVCALALAAARA